MKRDGNKVGGCWKIICGFNYARPLFPASSECKKYNIYIIYLGIGNWSHCLCTHLFSDPSMNSMNNKFSTNGESHVSSRYVCSIAVLTLPFVHVGNFPENYTQTQRDSLNTEGNFTFIPCLFMLLCFLH